MMTSGAKMTARRLRQSSSDSLLLTAPAVIIALVAGTGPVGIAIADIAWSVAGATAFAQVLARTRVWVWLAVAAVGALAGTPIALAAGGALGVLAIASFRSCGLRNRGWNAPDPTTRTLAIVASFCSTLVAFSLHDFARPGLSAAISGVLLIAGLLDIAIGTRDFVVPGHTHLKFRVVAATLIATSCAGLITWAALQSVELREQIAQVQALSNTTSAAGRAGDIDALATTARSARHDLETVDRSLGSLPLSLLRWTPLAGPNIGAMQRTNSTMLELLADAERLVESTSASELSDGRGGIATEELIPLATSFDEVIASIGDANDTVSHELGSPWLIPPLRDSLGEVQARFQEVSPLEDVDTTDALTSLLGVDSPMTYLVLLGNPAEARELGGFTAATAVVSVNNGSVESVETIRNGLLNQNAAPPAVYISPLPDRYLEHRPHVFAQNYTGAPDLPTVSLAMQQIFPAVAGHEIDGVIYMDAFALDAVLNLTGDVSVETRDLTFGPGELGRFLTRSQYAIDFESSGERETLFAELGEAVFGALASNDLNVDAQSLRQLTQMVREGRIALAPFGQEELSFVDAFGLSGAITPLRPESDFVAVTTVNGGPNKLDSYLHRETSYDVTITGDELRASTTIILDNRAPESLSSYAAGNVRDLPEGTNRLTLVVHSPHELIGWEGEETEPLFTRSFREYGRWRHERIVQIPQGESREITIHLAGDAPDRPYLLDVDAQPVVNPERFDATVRTAGVAPQRIAAFELRRDTTLNPAQ